MLISGFGVQKKYSLVLKQFGVICEATVEFFEKERDDYTPEKFYSKCKSITIRFSAHHNSDHEVKVIPNHNLTIDERGFNIIYYDSYNNYRYARAKRVIDFLIQKHAELKKSDPAFGVYEHSNRNGREGSKYLGVHMLFEYIEKTNNKKEIFYYNSPFSHKQKLLLSLI